MSFKDKATKFLNKWQGVNFDGGSTITDEFKSFNRGFKALMKEIGEIDTKSFNPGHFYTSGFIKINNKYVYVSVSDVRNFNDEWVNHILYRIAEDTKDYTGGLNHYSTLIELEDNIKRITRN